MVTRVPLTFKLIFIVQFQAIFIIHFASIYIRTQRLLVKDFNFKNGLSNYISYFINLLWFKSCIFSLLEPFKSNCLASIPANRTKNIVLENHDESTIYSRPSTRTCHFWYWMQRIFILSDTYFCSNHIKLYKIS